MSVKRPIRCLVYLVFGLALHCRQPSARDHSSTILTALHVVWSLTGHELLRWERPRCLCGSRAVLFVFFSGFALDQIRARRERFSWTGSELGRISRFFALSVLHYLCNLYCAFLAWGGHSKSYLSGLLQRAQNCVGVRRCVCTSRRIFRSLFWST